ncbi:MAG: hypothetical protein HYY45_08435 [Deltaproteobacteria bacterium]|nr:hypothetical protein [Deltaproteobacteria bacterium]
MSRGKSGLFLEPYRVLFLRPLTDREGKLVQAQDILKQIADGARRGLTSP